MFSTKVHSPAVLHALGEALRNVYWYKPDLRSFLARAGVPESILSQLDWTASKRDIVRKLLDGLARRPLGGTDLISKLLDSVVEQDEFPHLARLDDGARKVADAEAAISNLRNLLGRTSVVERADRARAEKRTESEHRKSQLVARQESMAGLSDEFRILAAMADVQARGLKFEPFLRKLFALHDLDPRGSYSLPGEQTDGSLRLDNHLYLVEARWRAEQASPDQVRSFRGKVEEKLDNTLGFYISMNGFTDEAIKRAAVPPAKVLLIDGQDLAPVMQGMQDLVEMLRRKVRHAAETGGVMFRV